MESANVVSENANVVRIMSIHKSKGLEFPVCIIAGCGRKFVNDTDDLRMHPQLGVGMRLTDPETGVRRTTFIREAIGLATAESASAEELRVFYVAMTRAKEKLILLSTVKNMLHQAARTAETAARAATLFSLLTTILQRLQTLGIKENMRQRTACPEKETKSTAKTVPILKSKCPAAQ